jgi:hydrogenase small subunit
MEETRATIWEVMQSRGYSRKDFLHLSSFLAAAAGIHMSGLNSVVEALEKKARPPVIWLHGQECTCCSESFIRTSHPVVADVVLDLISLDYTETLMAASGHQAEKSMQDTMKKYKGQYILCLEGAVPTNEGGVYCTIGGRTYESIVTEAADGAAAVIAWGSCASNGCIQAANPNPTGAKPVHKIISNSVVRVPGCPPIGDVMAAVVAHILVFGKIPKLDSLGRPREFYGRRVHDTCYRRAYYDAGLFVEAWDDENARKGYCLYKMGCRGPTTYNACSVTKWNNGTSYPIQSGHGCIGCSEEGFWDNSPFYDRLPNMPGIGIENTADTVGLALGVGTAAGIAAHAVSTNIRKREEIQQAMEESQVEKKD